MRETIAMIIRGGKYSLDVLLKRINYYHAAGALTDEDREWLVSFAREKATETIGNDMNVPEEILELWREIRFLKDRVNALEALHAEPAPADPEGGEEETPVETVPAWVQPTGAHDAYMTGDRILYTDGKIYVCRIDNCVWSPDVYPAGWEEETE